MPIVERVVETKATRNPAFTRVKLAVQGYGEIWGVMGSHEQPPAPGTEVGVEQGKPYTDRNGMQRDGGQQWTLNKPKGQAPIPQQPAPPQQDSKANKVIITLLAMICEKEGISKAEVMEVINGSTPDAQPVEPAPQMAEQDKDAYDMLDSEPIDLSDIPF